MLGKILHGLADAAAGARLWQHELHVRCGIERARQIGRFRRLRLERKDRLRIDDAVVIFHLVGELHRAARLRLGVLGEFNGRRLVGDRIERPLDVVTHATHGRSAVFLDREALLVGLRRDLR